MSFSATGEGQVSVAAGMSFVPARRYPQPVYRGLYVEKVIRAIDAQVRKTPSWPRSWANFSLL
jgi:hypothetical protein